MSTHIPALLMRRPPRHQQRRSLPWERLRRPIAAAWGALWDDAGWTPGPDRLASLKRHPECWFRIV